MPKPTRRRADAPREILVTGGAGFIGSTLTLALQQRWPSARITVVDDFRSGNFKNLSGFRGDVAASDAAAYRSDQAFDLVFHLASITDTTVHDQRLMVHDNVEGFRNILSLAKGSGAKIGRAHV